MGMVCWIPEAVNAGRARKATLGPQRHRRHRARHGRPMSRAG